MHMSTWDMTQAYCPCYVGLSVPKTPTKPMTMNAGKHSEEGRRTTAWALLRGCWLCRPYVMQPSRAASPCGDSCPAVSARALACLGRSASRREEESIWPGQAKALVPPGRRLVVRLTKSKE